MQLEWPTLSCPSKDGLKFWGHEWKKHGTCAESILDQHAYFETTLKLKNKINLLHALEGAGIYESFLVVGEKIYFGNCIYIRV